MPYTPILLPSHGPLTRCPPPLPPLQAFLARMLSLPGASEVADLMRPHADPDAIHAVRKFCVKEIAAALRPQLEALVRAQADEGAGW